MTEAQLTLAPLSLDISGDPQTPVPQPMDGKRCRCCDLHIRTLWQGTRAGFDESHAVCTLCYLSGHLDSPTAAHARLVWLPGVSLTNALHLQRQTLLAMIAGTQTQQREGKRVWRWMILHAREVEGAWGTARVGEFAAAMLRLPPVKRARLQERLVGCVPVFPPDVFDDLSLLLPEGKTAAQALTTWCFPTYCRSDLYAEPDPLD
ncbi:conjugal transfer protein TraT [Serratia fonticola]|uniref:conjugal transfer protein TraT n=1 Tax=Serratia fonticola TaxID=47917 RepID=UPI0016478881|nr:conjugal transfer protein TraT [Serratia fonticola]MBC3219722.1 conjugal transfer protein TraT [Serratia fonticola]